MKNLITLALIALALPACTTDDGPEGVNPEGDWAITRTWTVGNCPAFPRADQTFRVTLYSGDEYTVSFPGLTGFDFSNTVDCYGDTCTLIVGWELPGAASGGAGLTLDADGNITGQGMFYQNCSHQFTATGRLL